MSYCAYYQAHVPRATCWFFVAALRSYEHLAFDRTFDTASSTFEFFVPTDLESYFIELMNYFQAEGIISNLTKLPNRLKEAHALV
jgi:hypothetical protein